MEKKILREILEEKIDDNNKKTDELKQDSQRNMEVLNEKMAENNKKMNKKIEEEMAGIRQEISEVQGRLENANQEVRQVKTDFITRMTKFEEASHTQIEAI